MLTLVGSSNCDRYKLKFITILSVRTHTHTHTRIYIYIYIQGVTGGMCETLGECSLGQTIPI